jgi:hypothetical protein
MLWVVGAIVGDGFNEDMIESNSILLYKKLTGKGHMLISNCSKKSACSLHYFKSLNRVSEGTHMQISNCSMI